MTLEVHGPAADRPEAPPVVPVGRDHAARHLWALPVRLVRRGGIQLTVATAAYGVVEVVTYRQTYPDAASREQLVRLSDNTTMRMLQGAPRGVDTVGGFVVWDAGWFLAVTVAIWALLATTRLLRAEEDKGRAELVLARPLPAVQLVRAQLQVIGAVLVASGAGIAVTLALLGLGGQGCLLFGAGLAGVGATFAGVGALAAQLFDTRRAAVGAGAAFLGLTFVLRMIGNAEPRQAWLLQVTPFGWFDRLHAFTGDDWDRLLVLLLVPVVLAGLALRARDRRDLGAGRLSGRDHSRPHSRPYLLGHAASFGWRLGSGVLVAWTAGVAVFGVVAGLLLESVTDLLRHDDQYRRMLEQLGVDVSDPARGFLALIAQLLALVFAGHICWRIGALRAEEESGRLELLLVRPIERWRLLAMSAVLALAASAHVVLAAALGIWSGAAMGGTQLSASDAVVPLLATLPVVVVFGGLAVLTFAVLPRLTVALPAALAVLAYLGELLTSVLHLPEGVLDASPFRWLPNPPVQQFSGPASAVMMLVGAGAAAAGVVLFSRRDLVTE